MTTYAVGVLGEGGIYVSGAGGRRFEQVENGEFSSKRAALSAAAEIARECAKHGELTEMAVTRETPADKYPVVIGVATAKPFAKRVSWA